MLKGIWGLYVPNYPDPRDLDYFFIMADIEWREIDCLE